MGNLMTELPLVKGGRYFITHNIITKAGIVNGSEVELIGICTIQNSLRLACL